MPVSSRADDCTKVKDRPATSTRDIVLHRIDAGQEVDAQIARLRPADHQIWLGFVQTNGNYTSMVENRPGTKIPMFGYGARGGDKAPFAVIGNGDLDLRRPSSSSCPLSRWTSSSPWARKRTCDSGALWRVKLKSKLDL